MHLVTCQLDDFARFTDAQTHLRGATEDHADVTGELSGTENGDQKVAEAGRANDLDLTSLQHKERHVRLAAFDQYFSASDGTSHSVGGNSRDLRRRQRRKQERRIRALVSGVDRMVSVNTSRALDSLCERNVDTPDFTSMVTVRLRGSGPSQPRAHVELRAVQWAVTVEPSSVPSLNGPCCACTGVRGTELPSTLNTATSPISKTDPGGTSLIRNSFSLSGALRLRRLHAGCEQRLSYCLRVALGAGERSRLMRTA